MQALCPGTQRKQLSRAGCPFWRHCPFALVVPDRGVPLPDDRCELIYDLGDPSLFEFVETRQSVDFGLYQGRAIGEIHYRVLPIFNETILQRIIGCTVQPIFCISKRGRRPRKTDDRESRRPPGPGSHP